jgi:3-hydroxyisobutyrate dehydrogenase-like beta-hydroxyacid dehydrogenase
VDAVGVIGLGLMGGALADRFRAGGLRVVGYDPRPEAGAGLVALGGELLPSVRDVFAAVRVVVLSLPDSSVVADVMAEAGELRRGALVIDTTTGDPEATARLGTELAVEGCDYVDATLTGSSREARAGTLVVTAGGTADAVRRAEPLFRLFAKEWHHVGPWGSGARTKLVVNLVLGLNRAVLAEGLAFARRCGLDPAAVLEVLRGGGAYSRVMDTKGRKMLDADFAPDARLAQHWKDVRLILAEARRAGAMTPLSELHERVLAELVARGDGDLDNSSVIRAFEAKASGAA